MKALLSSLPHWSRSSTGGANVVRAAKTQISVMKNKCLWALACAGVLFASHSEAATNFAARVVSYNPGVDFSAGFTNTAAVLGDVSRVNPFGESTDPFNPPYGKDQVLSIGAGGSVTIEFERPVRNHPHNPFDIDFIVFGNSGFIITNDFDPILFDWVGVPATDGSLFGANTGMTRISVSRDGHNFYALAGAPTADIFAPTDGTGDSSVAIDPSLAVSDFAGATLQDIRALYQGSAGGTGFDISSARNTRGRRVMLSFIRFVRIEVLSGKAEVDAFSGVTSIGNPRK
jgi:hypothetical protein